MNKASGPVLSSFCWNDNRTSTGADQKSTSWGRNPPEKINPWRLDLAMSVQEKTISKGGHQMVVERSGIWSWGSSS